MTFLIYTVTYSDYLNVFRYTAREITSGILFIFRSELRID